MTRILSKEGSIKTEVDKLEKCLQALEKIAFVNIKLNNVDVRQVTRVVNGGLISNLAALGTWIIICVRAHIFIFKKNLPFGHV